MTYEFKVGDEGKTREGLPYRVLATDARGNQPIVAEVFDVNWCVYRFDVDGSYIRRNGIRDDCDLLPPQQTRKYWLVHYENGQTSFRTTKPDSVGAVAVTGPHTVTFTPGDGLGDA